MNRRDTIRLAMLPTPFEQMARLSLALGRDGQIPSIWIKRDDCTGFAGGGNKARKLEYLVADALNHGADVLVTVGAIQSNHARQTAAAAARNGLGCVLLLTDSGQEPRRGLPDQRERAARSDLRRRASYLGAGRGQH